MEQVLEQIKRGTLARVYVIHGPDQHKRKQILNALRTRALQGGFSDWNWVFYNDNTDLTAGELITDLMMTPWDGGVKIVAVSNCDQVNTDTWTALIAWLEANTNANSLALFFDKLDKRLKTHKSLLELGVEVECPPMTDAVLLRWVQDYVRIKGYTMKQEALELFLARVGTDSGFIETELEKLFLYTGKNQEINVDDVEQLTTIVPDQLEQRAIFEMVDALAAKKQDDALRVLHRLIDGGEQPLRIIPLIERQLRLLLAAKTRGSASFPDTAKLMGESVDFPLRKADRYHRNFTEDQLYDGFAAIINADRDLKLGVDGEYVLEQLVLRICL